MVHRKIPGGPQYSKFCVQLIGGGPQNIAKFLLGVHNPKRLKTAALRNTVDKLKIFSLSFEIQIWDENLLNVFAVYSGFTKSSGCAYVEYGNKVFD